MPKRNLIWVLAVVAAAVVAVLVARQAPRVFYRDGEPSSALAEAYETIRGQYYVPIDDERLGQAAVRAMVEELDEFSSYIPPEKVAAFRQRIEGRLRGVGLRFSGGPGRLVVLGALPDSPAYGDERVRRGDRVFAIDGRDAADLTVAAAERLLRGEPGSRVELRVLSPGSQSIRTVRMDRGEFPTQSVRGLYRGRQQRWVHHVGPESAGVVYVRITEFVRETARQFEEALARVGRCRGLILDLRDNPGGLPEVAVAVADVLLADGVIVKIVSHDGPEAATVHAARRQGTYSGQVPIVVLTNDRSASGAEIVAGALKVHHRAVLLGRRTRGKGCVQSMFDLGGELGMMNITTKQFLLAGDVPITRRKDRERWGVDPHRPVPLAAARQEKLRALWRRLPLVAPPAPTTRPATGPTTRPGQEIYREILQLDGQLLAAIELLQHPDELQGILDRARARARDAGAGEASRE